MQSVCWFGVINQWPPVLFEQFWNCPFFILAISKFSKMHSGNLSQIAFLNMWLLIQISRIRTCDMKWTTLKVHTDEMMKLDSDKWICDNWLRRGGTIYSYFTKGNNWKLFHPCDVISYNVTNFLITRQSGRNIIIAVMRKTYDFTQIVSMIQRTVYNSIYCVLASWKFWRNC